MKPTARGYYLVVHPAYDDSGNWYVTSCNSQGNWKAAVLCKSQEDANNERRRIRQNHAKSAAKTVARAAKRKA
jgi:hypothetical protein